MFRRLVFASLAVGIAAGAVAGGERAARANGRLPATSSITFRQGHDSDVVAGLTFGLVISHDGGRTWAWMCDEAIGINSGPYDPTYAYTSAGTVFATTLAGLAVMRDGCAFTQTPEGKNFVSTNALGPDGAFYYGAAQTADTAHGIASDFKIYRSVDDGATFPVAKKPGEPGDTNVWWQSIMAAPSSPQVVYVSGFRYVPDQSGGTRREHLVFRSDNAGTDWTPLAGTGLVTAPNSIIHIVGIANELSRHVYARVEYIDNTTTDALYVSDDSGANWTEIHRQADRFVAFVARAAVNAGGKHDLIAATTKFPPEVSHDDGAHWEPLVNPPHIGCLTENAAGELWACTQNYGVAPAPTDGAGIMKTTDLATWTKVLRYEDLTEAVTSCGSDTAQQKTCVPKWCAACAQLSCTPAASYACPSLSEAPITPPRTKAGCCDTGSDGTAPLALALSVATLVLRPRRRHPR